MTIIEAITRIDAIKPNAYRQSEKIAWISSIDSTIMREIIETHEGDSTVIFDGYTDNTPLTTELLVPAPYDELYLYYLESRIDYWNGETKRYNNSIKMFNEAYSNFAKYYNRTHMPKGRNIAFFPQRPSFELEVSTGVAKVTVKED